jgi:hypothetical protein
MRAALRTSDQDTGATLRMTAVASPAVRHPGPVGQAHPELYSRLGFAKGHNSGFFGMRRPMLLPRPAAYLNSNIPFTRSGAPSTSAIRVGVVLNRWAISFLVKPDASRRACSPSASSRASAFLANSELSFLRAMIAVSSSMHFPRSTSPIMPPTTVAYRIQR